MAYKCSDWCSLSILKGKTLSNLEQYGEELLFTTVDGEKFRMWHEQDCCESVWIESIVGDLEDLVGSEIFVAEEVSSYDMHRISDYHESYTWTFYKFATIKGYVDVRWYGCSNGYYSEGVSFARV